jgi:hypothetical protein
MTTAARPPLVAAWPALTLNLSPNWRLTMKRKWIIAAAVACGLASLAAPVAGAHPALAAGCYATGCNGLDPVAEGCSGDAVTIASNTSNGYIIEIRYSNTCHAAWARATASPDTDGLLEAEITGWPCNVAGGKKCTGTTEDYFASGYWQIWSNMVGWTYLQACTNQTVYGTSTRLCTSLVTP